MIAKWIGVIFIICVWHSGNALECYACDSNEDTECATRPGQQLNVEECNENDECVTVVSAGITRRGCLSRLFPNKYCPEPCDKCSTNLCNRNIFPANRLRCYQCTGSNCLDVTSKSSLLLPCPFYHEKDRCYMNVIGTTNVWRGCVYTNLPDDCPNTCIKCDFDGCNNEIGVFEETCYECRHTPPSPNPNCLRNQVSTSFDGPCSVRSLKTCRNKVLHGHASRCFHYVNEQTGVVDRGCSTTKGLYPTGTLVECIGKNCNNDCISIACSNCTSTLDGFNCRKGTNLNAQVCEDGTFACYSCEGGPKLRRGCADSTFKPSIDEVCYQCRSIDGCNNTPIRTCYHCSSLENKDCSRMMILGTIEQRNCTGPDELCVSTLISKLDYMYTIRGCASSISECTSTDPYCVRCNGSLCNKEEIEFHNDSQKIELHAVEETFTPIDHIDTSSRGNRVKPFCFAQFNLEMNILFNFIKNIYKNNFH